MRRAFRIGAAVVGGLIALLAITVYYVFETRHGQEFALERVAKAIFAAEPATRFDGLRVFLCGSGSPLAGCAQACVAVTAGQSLYLVDAGMGSLATMQLAGEPTRHLRAVLVTHLHSDHITGIPDFNLSSWVGGRPEPLVVMGPTGIDRVVAGFNEAMAVDRTFRIAHHGAELLPPDLGVMQAEVIEPGVVVERDGLTITAFAVDHAPVVPAFGFRFDFRGRSVVVSGDTVVTDSLETAARGADLLLHDVLSVPIIGTLERAAAVAGARRRAKILADIQTYHASAAELGALAERTGVGMLAVYHYVPPPRTLLLERVYRRELPSDAVMTRDGTVFELPASSSAIRVLQP